MNENIKQKDMIKKANTKKETQNKWMKRLQNN